MNTTHVIVSSPPDASRLGWESAISLTLVGDSVQVSGLLSYRKNIREVKFLDNTLVADRILQHCNNIQKVTFSTSTEDIGDCAFNQCHSLEELSFSGTKIARIGSFAFHKCTSLSKIHLTPHMYQLGASCFQSCTGLIEVVFPHGGHIEKIPNMAFASCSSLTSLDLGTIREIGYRAFDSCDGLTEVNIPDTVKAIHDMAFLNCSRLQKLTFANNPDVVLGNHAFDLGVVQELYCSPELITRYDFTTVPTIVCEVTANTLSGDRYPFRLTLPLESKDFIPEQQFLRQTDIDTQNFVLMVDNTPLRASLDKARMGEIDLLNIVVFYNSSTDLITPSNRSDNSLLVVSDIPGLEHENIDKLTKHGFHTLLSLIGVLLIYSFDSLKLINFVKGKSHLDVANKVSDAIDIAMKISMVYVPGNIYLTKSTTSGEARLIPFTKMKTLGGIDKLPTHLTESELARFREKDITHIYHLVGHYFKFNRDPDLLEMFLLDFVNQEKAESTVNFIHRDLLYQQV